MRIITKIEVHNSSMVVNDYSITLQNGLFEFVADSVDDFIKRINNLLPSLEVYNELPDEEKELLSDITINSDIVRTLNKRINNNDDTAITIYRSDINRVINSRRRYCSRYFKIMCKIKE
jgi:hypothetical protein